MAVFVRSEIARSGKKERSERRHRLALPIGTKKRFLDDFFRGFTRPDEAPNVSMQRFTALSEELGENLGVGVGGDRHGRVIGLDLRYAHQGLHGNSGNSNGGFYPLGCRVHRRLLWVPPGIFASTVMFRLTGWKLPVRAVVFDTTRQRRGALWT
jgi:hypothetical protein